MAISRTGQALGKFTVCTSSTRPSSPSQGDGIYETDTGAFKEYQGATDTWTPPWNTAWGYVGEAVVTSSQASISTLADVTSLTVTFTAQANRRYRIILALNELTQQTSNGVIQCVIADGSNNRIAISQGSVLTSGNLSLLCLAPTQSPAAGSVTWKARCATSAGTCTVVAAATQPVSILIEDIGPNGAPS